jgi:hypothetical protein
LNPAGFLIKPINVKDIEEAPSAYGKARRTEEGRPPGHVCRNDMPCLQQARSVSTGGKIGIAEIRRRAGGKTIGGV